MLPMASFRSVRDVKVASLTFQRLLAALAGTIAALAMVLSAMGFRADFEPGDGANERARDPNGVGLGVGRAIQVALQPGLIWVLCGVAAGAAAALGLNDS